MQSSMNWFNKYKHQLYYFPSFAQAASSTAATGTSIGLHFINTHLANNWTMNLSTSYLMFAASCTRPPFECLNSFVSFAASFRSKFFPTKCEAGSMPTLLKPMIWWMTSMFTSILWLRHKYASCTQESKILTTAFISIMRAKCRMCNRLSSRKGASFSIHSYGAKTSTCVIGSIFLHMY